MEALTLLQWLFDALLGVGLLWLAWRALTSPDLFTAIVFFVSFGLLMALAWVSLDAPDVALAEAAIGAGLTGAMLLAALAKLRSREKSEKDSGSREYAGLKNRRPAWLPVVLLLLIAAGLGYVVLSLPPDSAGMSALVTENLASSGVKNPVTAVLLNFRGYDTMLEMVVLLLALLGVWSLNSTVHRDHTAPGVMLDSMARFLTPVMILVAAYLLWVGAHAPGGAFQAGSILGAAGVLLLLTKVPLGSGQRGLPFRFLLVAGTGTFVAIAGLTLLWTGTLLEYPPARAGTLILILETAATVSIGALLAALFWGAPPESKEKS